MIHSRPSRPRTAALTVLLAAALALTACGPRGPQRAPTGSPASGRVETRTVPPVKPAPRPIPLAEKVAPLGEGAYLGAYSPPVPFEGSSIDRFEAAAGKPVSIVMWYQPWVETNRSRVDSGAIVSVWRSGHVPMITWEPWDPGTYAGTLKNPAKQPRFTLSAIVAGRYDDYIRSWAVQIRDLGGPVMLRPMQEMNGFWYPWCGTVNGNKPADYVSAWRHIHAIFDEVGATNVTWVWSINHESVPKTQANRYAAYYPGDAYVDWVAVSGFNWGTTTRDSNWGTYDHWFDGPLRYLRTLGKPVCIAEFSSVEQGGSKPAWITDAFARISKDHTIKAAVFYDALERNSSGTQDWRLTSSSASTRAYGTAVATSYFSGDAPPALTAWVARLEPEEWQRLANIAPLY